MANLQLTHKKKHKYAKFKTHLHGERGRRPPLVIGQSEKRQLYRTVRKAAALPGVFRCCRAQAPSWLTTYVRAGVARTEAENIISGLTPQTTHR